MTSADDQGAPSPTGAGGSSHRDEDTPPGSMTEERPSPPESPPEDSGGFRMGTVGRHTLIYGLGLLLQRVVSFVMLPVYTRYLTPADYGIMGLIEMTLDVIAVLAGAQVAVGIFRFYHKVDTDRERDSVVSTAMLCLGLSYLGVAAVSFLAAPFLSDLIFGSDVHTTLIRLASASLFFTSLTIVPLAYARVRDRSVLFVVANLVKLALALTLNLIALVVLELGILGVFVSNLLASAVVGLWLAGWVFRSVGLRFSREATRDLLRYGAPLVATHLALFIVTFADRYFIQAVAEESAVGIYSLAYQFGFLLAALGFAPFEAVWAPKRFEIAKRSDRDEVLSQGFEFLNILLLTVGVGIALFVSDVIHIMTTPAFYSAASLTPIILFAYIFQAWAGTQDLGIMIREKTEYLTVANWIAALVALVGYATLVPRYLGVGAALATVASLFTRWALTYVFSQRLWYVRYHWGPPLRLLMVALLASGVGLYFPRMSLVASVASKSLLLVGYAVVAWFWALSPGARLQLAGMADGALATFRASRRT